MSLDSVKKEKHGRCSTFSSLLLHTSVTYGRLRTRQSSHHTSFLFSFSECETSRSDQSLFEKQKDHSTRLTKNLHNNLNNIVTQAIKTSSNLKSSLEDSMYPFWRFYKGRSTIPLQSREHMIPSFPLDKFIQTSPSGPVRFCMTTRSTKEIDQSGSVVVTFTIVVVSVSRSGSFVYF